MEHNSTGGAEGGDIASSHNQKASHRTTKRQRTRVELRGYSHTQKKRRTRPDNVDVAADKSPRKVSFVQSSTSPSSRVTEFRSTLLLWEPFVPDPAMRAMCDNGEVCHRIVQATRGEIVLQDHAKKKLVSSATHASSLVSMKEFQTPQGNKAPQYTDQYIDSSDKSKCVQVASDALAQLTPLAYHGEAYLDVPDRFDDPETNARICASAAQCCCALVREDKGAARVRYEENYAPAALASALLCEIQARCKLSAACSEDLVTGSLVNSKLPQLRVELIKARAAVRIRLELHRNQRGHKDASECMAQACLKSDYDVWIPIHAVPRAWLKALACRNHAVRVRATASPAVRATPSTAQHNLLPGAHLVAMSLILDRYRVRASCAASLMRQVVIGSVLRQLMAKQFGCRGVQAYVKLASAALSCHRTGASLSFDRVCKRTRAPGPDCNWTHEHTHALELVQKCESGASNSTYASSACSQRTGAGAGFRLCGDDHAGLVDVLRATIARAPRLCKSGDSSSAEGGTLIIVGGDVEACHTLSTLLSSTYRAPEFCTPLVVKTVATLSDLDTPLIDLTKSDITVIRFAILTGNEYVTRANAQLYRIMTSCVPRVANVDYPTFVCDTLGRCSGLNADSLKTSSFFGKPASSAYEMERVVAKEHMFEDDVCHSIRWWCRHRNLVNIMQLHFPCVEMLHWSRVVHMNTEMCRELDTIQSIVRWTVEGLKEERDESDCVFSSIQYPSLVKSFVGARQGHPEYNLRLENILCRLGEPQLRHDIISGVISRECMESWTRAQECSVRSSAINVSALQAMNLVDTQTVTLRSTNLLANTIKLDIVDVPLHDAEAMCMVMSEGACHALFSSALIKSDMTSLYHKENMQFSNTLPGCAQISALAADSPETVCKWVLGEESYTEAQALAEKAEIQKGESRILETISQQLKSLLTPSGPVLVKLPCDGLLKLTYMETRYATIWGKLQAAASIEGASHVVVEMQSPKGVRKRRKLDTTGQSSGISMSAKQIRGLCAYLDRCSARAVRDTQETEGALSMLRKQQDTTLHRARAACSELLSSSEDSCSICAVERQCVITKCLHMGCAACVSMSISSNGACPTCNTSVKPNEVAYVVNSCADARLLYEQLEVPTVAKAIYEWVIDACASGKRALVLCPRPLHVGAWLTKLHNELHCPWVVYHGSFAHRRCVLEKLARGEHNVCIASTNRRSVGLAKFEKVLILPPDLGDAAQDLEDETSKPDAMRIYHEVSHCLKADTTVLQIVGSSTDTHLSHLIAGYVQSQTLKCVLGIETSVPGDAVPPTVTAGVHKDNHTCTYDTHWKAYNKRAVFDVGVGSHCKHRISVPLMTGISEWTRHTCTEPDAVFAHSVRRRIRMVKNEDEHRDGLYSRVRGEENNSAFTSEDDDDHEFTTDDDSETDDNDATDDEGNTDGDRADVDHDSDNDAGDDNFNEEQKSLALPLEHCDASDDNDDAIIELEYALATDRDDEHDDGNDSSEQDAPEAPRLVRTSIFASRGDRMQPDQTTTGEQPHNFQYHSEAADAVVNVKDHCIARLLKDEDEVDARNKESVSLDFAAKRRQSTCPATLIKRLQAAQHKAATSGRPKQASNTESRSPMRVIVGRIGGNTIRLTIGRNESMHETCETQETAHDTDGRQDTHHIICSDSSPGYLDNDAMNQGDDEGDIGVEDDDDQFPGLEQLIRLTAPGSATR